jgi:hypothetical protein
VVQSVVVLGGHEEFFLLFSQVLVWVQVCFSQDVHVLLQFLDLVQVMDESFALLLY